MDLLNDLIGMGGYGSKRPHPIGRPPKLTAEIIEQICDSVISGSSIAYAAKSAGISESTIYRWLALGREGDADSIYVDLVNRVREATECSEFELLQGMRIAAKQSENWRALAWLLERRYPERYAKRTEHLEVNSKQKPEEGTSPVLVAV